VSWYEINLQKSIAFLYINNEQTEVEYWKTTSFIIALKNLCFFLSNIGITTLANVARFK
jgi:hypothetical protein